MPVTAVGAPGFVAGTTAPDGLDGKPTPTEFVAVTVKVYLVPLVSPLTVQPDAAEFVHVSPPGDDVTV